MHLVFDLPKDKMIWDVGHQSYTHKILTGRKDGFDDLTKIWRDERIPEDEKKVHAMHLIPDTALLLSRQGLGMCAQEICRGKITAVYLGDRRWISDRWHGI